MPGDAKISQHHLDIGKIIKSFLLHPIGAALLTFLSTGVGAALFSNYLDSISKKRDLELAASRRAIDSVSSVTNLIFERDTRANFLSSSIKRHAPIDEIKDRKKAYDDIFIRYNSTIQTNLFKIREIFHSSDYTDFERLVEGPLRDLLIAEDSCVTNSFDAAVTSSLGSSAAQPSPGPAIEVLAHCTFSSEQEKNSIVTSFQSLYQAILHCEYTFSDSLFRIVQDVVSEKTTLNTKEDKIMKACLIKNTI